mmetsp:Transcript_11757/g.30183  ORF Transcript_11757/g.30183 Transcript_11757/m.30183 type:complete len:99 (-) Transcript_11757:43-339(-)
MLNARRSLAKETRAGALELGSRIGGLESAKTTPTSSGSIEEATERQGAAMELELHAIGMSLLPAACAELDVPLMVAVEEVGDAEAAAAAAVGAYPQEK